MLELVPFQSVVNPPLANFSSSGAEVWDNEFLSYLIETTHAPQFTLNH